MPYVTATLWVGAGTVAVLAGSLAVSLLVGRFIRVGQGPHVSIPAPRLPQSEARQLQRRQPAHGLRLAAAPSRGRVGRHP